MRKKATGGKTGFFRPTTDLADCLPTCRWVSSPLFLKVKDSFLSPFRAIKLKSTHFFLVSYTFPPKVNILNRKVVHESFNNPPSFVCKLCQVVWPHTHTFHSCRLTLLKIWVRQDSLTFHFTSYQPDKETDRHAVKKWPKRKFSCQYSWMIFYDDSHACLVKGSYLSLLLSGSLFTHLASLAASLSFLNFPNHSPVPWNSTQPIRSSLSKKKGSLKT